MAQLDISSIAGTSSRLNVADRLASFAAQMPAAIAVAAARKHSTGYSTITFAELDADASRIAHGLADWGVKPGTRLALLVRPGIDFVTLVFALLRAGVVMVLVDPGLGRKNLLRCLAETEPEGFIAIPQAHAVRMFVRGKFPHAKWNVTVGRRWFWGGTTLESLRRRGGTRSVPATLADDPAATIFTSGSTGPPKGVLYTHRMFDTQVAEIQSMYGIEPGGIDLSCFPLFALFNSAMGVTTVLPDMDFSRPASADPEKLLAAANDWKVTQAFASPVVWRILGEHCGATGQRIDTLRNIFSCGAPVPANVLWSTLAFASGDAKMHTPYGATECLPVATIEAAEVLGETASRTEDGAGVCVGLKFDSIDWRVIRVSDDPIASIDAAEELAPGEIGELIVHGPQASPRYVTQTECNGDAKIADQRAGSSSTPTYWHRMGDVGYIDNLRRFWYCGRKSQRVDTTSGTLFTECVEAVVNSYVHVWRSALVGIGRPGSQTPVLIVEPAGTNYPPTLAADLIDFLQWASPPTASCIKHVLVHHSLPVDIRHNAKINREQLAAWAAKQLPELS